jgi:hypothetical protein
MVRDQKMTAPVANALKEACGIPLKAGSKAEPNAFMFVKCEALGGARPVDMVLGLHKDNDVKAQQPQGDGLKTGPQTAIDLPRQVPGGEANADLQQIHAGADKDVAAYMQSLGIQPATAGK